MNLLLRSLIGALLMPLFCLAAEQPTAKPAAPASSTSLAPGELEKIDAADDAAQAEVDKWTEENNLKRTKGEGLSDAELERKIAARFEPVLKAYETFVQQHPESAPAHQAFGNFLNARDDERAAQTQWEKALELDPQNPSLYNSLAGRYSESGPVNKGFEYFTKAISLDPKQAAYYYNFANVLFVRRQQAAAFYRITEQAVYGRALLMYSNALRLEPLNFNFARELAQTYYSLKPIPYDQALHAWTNALKIAREESEREDACVHLARVKMLSGRFDEARAQLTTVTNESSLKLKTNLLKAIQERETAPTNKTDRPAGQ